jgi:hypothetical protein
MQEIKKPRKAGSGRPKGSFSFVLLTAEQLSAIGGMIPVSRVWAQEKGIEAVSAPAAEIKKPLPLPEVEFINLAKE